MDGVSFRLATAADLPALLRLLVDDAVAQARGGYTTDATPAVRAAFDEIARDPNNELWLGERDGEVVAMLQLTLIPGLSRGGMKGAVRGGARARRPAWPAHRRSLDGAGRGAGQVGRLRADPADHRPAAAGRAPLLRAAGLRRQPCRDEEEAVKAKELVRVSSRRGSKAESRCARCGTPFHCGIADAGGCWCARLPPLPREAYAATAGCLCEDCLRQMLDAVPARRRETGG
jgi:ribosomal protein L34E